MQGNILTGIQYFFRGIKLILSPDLRRYIWVPIIVNLFLMIGIFVGIALFLQHYMVLFLASYPQWLILIAGGLFWILYSLISLLVGTLLFTMLTNLIASPFYGILSERIEEKVEGQIQRPFTMKMMLLLWYHTFLRECRKLLYFVPGLLICISFLIFPFLSPLFPIVWWAIMSWMMVVQYSDYAADNQGIPLKQMIITLKQQSLTTLSFGSIVSIALAIPILNIVVPLIAVAGGTLLWIDLNKQQDDLLKINSKDNSLDIQLR